MTITTDNVGEALMLYREAKRITQKELSDITGISRATLAAYECNARSPQWSKLVQLIEALGCSVEMREVGRWETTKKGIECNLCGKAVELPSVAKFPRFIYCPYCGSRMLAPTRDN